MSTAENTVLVNAKQATVCVLPDGTVTSVITTRNAATRNAEGSDAATMTVDVVDVFLDGMDLTATFLSARNTVCTLLFADAVSVNLDGRELVATSAVIRTIRTLRTSACRALITAYRIFSKLYPTPMSGTTWNAEMCTCRTLTDWIVDVSQSITNGVRIANTITTHGERLCFSTNPKRLDQTH